MKKKMEKKEKESVPVEEKLSGEVSKHGVLGCHLVRLV